MKSDIAACVIRACTRFTSFKTLKKTLQGLGFRTPRDALQALNDHPDLPNVEIGLVVLGMFSSIDFWLFTDQEKAAAERAAKTVVALMSVPAWMDTAVLCEDFPGLALDFRGFIPQ